MLHHLNTYIFKPLSFIYMENIPPSLSNMSSANPSINKKKPSGGKTIEETYTKKSQLEHILLRPDTYGTFNKNIDSRQYILL